MIDNKCDYATVAASQSDQRLGSALTGNILEALIIVPATTSPDAVSIKDGSSSTGITVFTGGASSVNELRPIVVKFGIRNITSTNPGFFVTTGANVSVIAVGRFQ